MKYFRRAVPALLCALLAWLSLPTAWAEHAAVPGSGAQFLPFALLRDPAGALSVADVASRAQASRFQAIAPGLYNIGYTRDVVWLRVELHNPHPNWQRMYLDVGPPRLVDVRFFEAIADEGWHETRSGLQVPSAQRDVPSRQPLLRTALDPGETRTVYVRIASGNAIAVQAVAWTPRDFMAWEGRVDQVNMLQFGAIGLFALYALLIGLAARERVYFSFSLVLAAFGLYEAALHQYTHAWLWPTLPDWSMRSPGVLVALGTAAFLWLIDTLLQLRARRSRWWYVLLALVAAQLLVVPGMVWLEYSTWVLAGTLLGVVSALALLLATLSSVRDGFRPARLVLLAFTPLWLVWGVRTAALLGLAPATVFAGEYAQVWVILVCGLLMATFTARTIQTTREEQARIQQHLLQATADDARRLEAEVRARTQDLEIARRRAEEASAAKSAFLAQMSHEFRTPLHGVLGYASLMQEEARNPADRRRLESIQRSGSHLLALIDELLEFTRAEAGRLTLEAHPVALQRFLEDIVEEMQAVARAAGLSLALQVQTPLPAAVSVDQVRLRQVLLNLLGNACRHSQGRQLHLEVRTATVVGDCADVCFGVRDDGIGLSVADQEHLFDLFWQRQPGAAAGGGLGLGLPISQQWVRRMGGELQAESREGEGCLFHFCLRLPVVSLPAGPALEDGAMAAATPVVPSGTGVPWALVVDDREENRELLAEMLRTLGVEPVLADGGDAALRLLDKVPFSLVLVDQLMPGMDGWETLQRARAAGHLMPFVLVSATAPTPPAGWATAPGFSAFLGKPVPLARLRAEIGRLLGGSDPGPSGAMQDGTAVAALVRPSPAALARLRAAAAMGLVSDLEDWVRDTRAAEPAATAFVEAVEAALQRIDLRSISALAGDQAPD